MDFSFITSLFNSEHAQLALRTSGDWLPAAGWFVGISTTLAIAAVLVVFFLKMVSLGIKLAIGAAVFAVFAVLAFGYQAKGENNIIPKLNAANARIVSDESRAKAFADDIAILQAKLAVAVGARRAALAAAAKSNQERLNAQPITITSTAVSPVVVRFVNDAVAEAADKAFGPGAGDKARAASASGKPINVGDWEAWSATAAIEHGRLAVQVNLLQDLYDGLAKASATADAEHPPDKPQTEPHR